jgi:hypothetical protein
MTRKNVKSATPKQNGEISSEKTYRSSTGAEGSSLTRLLYHTLVTRLTRPVLAAAAVAVLVTFLATGAPAGRAPDRLERFRELAASRLALGDVAEGNPAEVYRDIYALLDDEIVESLASGGVFASPAFLQDRLDAFGEAWGGAHIRLTRLGSLVAGAFRLSDTGLGNSVRVYGRLHGESALLATLHRDGRPSITPLDATQFLAIWEGTPNGRGTRPLRIDLVRVHGEGAHVMWSTAALFPDGLHVRAYAIRPTEIRLRYELQYPGWTPGCEGQTEQEDVYRLVPAQSTAVRMSRQEHNSWHRELHVAAARFFAALAERDESLLAAVVPDPALRARLPALSLEPACDGGDGRETASIAASSADGRPWTLTFRRAGPRWRLTSANVVGPLQ